MRKNLGFREVPAQVKVSIVYNLNSKGIRFEGSFLFR